MSCSQGEYAEGTPRHDGAPGRTLPRALRGDGEFLLGRGRVRLAIPTPVIVPPPAETALKPRPAGSPCGVSLVADTDPGGPLMTTTQDAAPGQAALVAKHAERLDAALTAIAGRGYWSAYPESPSPRVYGEGTAEAGKAAFEAHLGKRFPLGQPGADGWVGDEASPYGVDLGVSYEHLGADALIGAATAALPGWRAAGPQVRAAVCLEILDRINARSFEIAHAVMHTSGQAFVMSFQAGGTHAQDRALEAVAYAYAEQTRHADTAVWEKPQGKRPALRMEKTFTPVPRGIALVVGCTTFPTWNAYPGLFASLATGNAVIVKPHPGAVLPLAITVAVARDMLGEFGFDPNTVVLAAEAPGE